MLTDNSVDDLRPQLSSSMLASQVALFLVSYPALYLTLGFAFACGRTQSNKEGLEHLPHASSTPSHCERAVRCLKFLHIAS